MLAIPRISSTGQTDPTAAIDCLVRQHGCPEELVRSDFETFSRLRERAVNVPEHSELGQQALLSYSRHLQAFIPRFEGLESQLKLNFGWNDAFGLRMKTNSASFYVEWACILWNLAAFESTAGARVDRTTEDGIRAASRHFQQAAGYIEYLIESILPHLQLQLSSFPCLSLDGVNMAKQLMLAQAQLCFYEKAVKDKKAGKMKAGIIAKLAKQTALFYGAASSSCRSGTLGSFLDNSWFAITDFQTKCFLAATEYWQAHASKEVALANGSGYGEEVARFRRAEQRINECLAQQQPAAAITPSLVAGAQGLKAAALEHMQAAMKDLNTIYLESVPSDDSLAEVTPVAMVRPAAFPAATADNSSETVALFKYVLPQEVRVLVQKFSEEAAAAYQSTSAAAENATNSGRSSLSAVGLPGSLEAAKTESPLPQSLWAKVQQAQSSGGFVRLRAMFAELMAASKRTQDSLQNIDGTIEREERTDEEFLRRFPDWSGARSVQLNSDVRTNSLRMREALRAAQSSDANLGAELNKSEATQAAELLSKSREQLLQMFPTQASAAAMAAAAASHSLLDFDEELDGPKQQQQQQGLGAEGQQLEMKLHEMADVVMTRSQQLETLRSVCHQDIGERLAAAMSKHATGADYRTIYAAEIGKCSALQQELEDGVQKQQSLLQDIMRLNDAFVKSRQQSPLAAQRGAVISTIEQSWAKFNLLFSQISAGMTFYSSLQAKLTGLLQNACDIAYTQQWQRQDFEAQRNALMERSAQEMRDREMAMKLADDLANSGPVSSHPAATTAATGGSGAVVYGTAVNNSQFAYPGLDSFNSSNGNSSGGNVSAISQSTFPAAPTPPPAYAPHYAAAAAGPPPAAAAPVATPPGGVAGVYQYNNSNYSVAATTAAASQFPNSVQQPQYNIPQQQSSSVEFNNKVSRLAEMGFPRDQVAAMLSANNGDEEAALNALLSSAAASDSNANNAPQKPQKNSMFKVWGKK